MNKEAVASELVKIAEELTAGSQSILWLDIHEAAGKVLDAGRGARYDNTKFRNQETSRIYGLVADECSDIYKRLVALKKRIEDVEEREVQIRKNIE